MNSDDIVSAFVKAGFDTPEKAQAALTNLNLQLQIKIIDVQLEGLGAKQAELIKPLQDLRIQLTNQRSDLTAALAPTS